MRVDSDNVVEFTCVPEICTYNSKDYKAYGTQVDIGVFPNIKLNKYNNVSIVGNIHDLGIGIEYKVKAVETNNAKHGTSYKIVNIRREKPTDIHSTRQFLYEILTPNQADVLLQVYPDIVDRVMSDRLDDIDLNLTYGIKEYTFNVIKKKIVENFCLVELVDEFQGLISISILKKLYEKYPSIQKIRNEIKNEPYKCLCGLYGIGFKTADGLLMEIDRISQENVANGKTPIIDFGYELKTSQQREKACIMFLLEENQNNGHTKLNVEELKKQCNKLAPACVQHFVDIIKYDDDIHYDKNTRSVALKKTYNTEMYIANAIFEGLKQNVAWNIDYKKYIKGEDIELTEEQSKALEFICKHNLFILNGYGGSGKSASTNAIIKMLNDNGKTFKLLAPTGKASKVLAAYSKEPASTIHRGLGYIPPNLWGYNEEDKLFCDVVIIDEFSMVDIFIMEKVLNAIDFSKTKLMLIGDDFQIPSVGAGNILYDLINSKVVPIITLTKIFRYGKGGVLTAATKTRIGEKFLNEGISHTTLGEDKSYMFINLKQENIISNLKKLYTKLLNKNNKPQDIMILSSYNVGDYGTININKHIQLIANSNCLKSKGFEFGDTTYFKDDLVIQTVNNYKSVIYNGYIQTEGEAETTFISNGDTGVVKEVLKNHIVVTYDDVDILYSRDDMGQLKLAYAISLHKSQGDSCKIVILITPKAHTYMLNANLLYVGQTRAKEKCFHFGEVKTVNNALKKKANFNRSTYLKEFLTSNKSNEKDI